MEFKKFNDLGIKLEEGVLITKYLIPIHIADYDTAVTILDTLKKHKYNVDVVPGAFLKVFAMNMKEEKELEEVLAEVDTLGLKDVWNVNLAPRAFKRSFLEKVKFCIHNHIAYLNPDNTFVSHLYDNERFGAYTKQIPLEQVATVEQVNEEPIKVTSEEIETEAKMTAEDKQVYSEIVEKLNFLILRNATDEVLVKVAKNIMNKIPASILNGEYHYFSLNDMIKGIMFDGIDVTPEVSERIEKLIDEEFPVIKEGRNLA